MVARDAQADLLPNLKSAVWLGGKQKRANRGEKGSKVEKKACDSSLLSGE